MLRIAELVRETQTTMWLEGKVAGPWVDELRRAADCHLAKSSLVLDLSDMTFADAEGIALLRELASRGVSLVNCSAFAAAHLGNSSEP